MKKKTLKEVTTQKPLVWACKSQDLAQSQKICARSHDPETVTFRNSGLVNLTCMLEKNVIPTRSLATHLVTQVFHMYL